MIFINRKNEPVPQILIDKAAIEHQKAEIYYRSEIYLNNPKRPGFKKFKLYSHESVKKALERLFNEKCAYCEIQVTVGHDIDKEHFRPKAMVKDSMNETVPGYYWLSADWNNLFLSCTHCNQWREQPIQNGLISMIGKANQFPLLHESKRAKSPSDPSDDPYRLLINPCVDNPEDFFSFDKDGSIMPKIRLRGKKRKMAEVSAEVFALIRLRLVKKREKHFVMVEKLIVEIERRLRDYLRYQTNEYKDELVEKLEELKQLQDEKNPHNEFVAVTRQLVEEHKAKLLNAINIL